MGYLNSDFQRIWKIVKKKIATDSKYLEKIQRKYNLIFQDHKRIFRQINKLNLKTIDNTKLMEFLSKTIQALIDSVGIAHIVDAIGIEIEKEFKKDLLKVIGPIKEFNHHYALLTTPTQPSFFVQEEKQLRSLSKLPLSQKKALIKHSHEYFWLRNSYAGPKYLTETDFAKSLKLLNKQEEKNSNIKKQKNTLIKKLNLNSAIQKKIQIIDFTSIWQDQRKANVLISLGYLGMIVHELARRLKINPELLYYLGVKEALNIKSIQGFKDLLKRELIKRHKGTFVLMDDNKEFISQAKDYKKILKLKESLIKQQTQQNGAIHGSIANTGTAVGRVVVCKGINSLSKVKKGDILVTSMTRPEFMPALKKAAAIITDEGGVTCHAAIVARELNIPAVIGTKLATKILKDGMIVEVKGNHGIINIVG
ncbi:hypothetical protein KKG58_05800 [Patescibacteria group bacterium]|nr:hypothetical protein [Patescibacteria group bacterium]